MLLYGVPLPRLRARAGMDLLALLALHPQQSSERSRLAATLWPDSSEEQALYNLRRNLVDLRHALGDQAWRLHSPTSRTLQLDLDNAFCDVQVFDTLLQDRSPAAKERRVAAVALYRGPLLEGCTDDWALEERNCREQVYLAALEALSEEAKHDGRGMEAAGYLRRVIAADPYRETAQLALMEALASAGYFAAVAIAYRELRLLLLREFRSEPSLEIQNFYRNFRLLPSQKGRVLQQRSGAIGGADTSLPEEKKATSSIQAATSLEADSPSLPYSMTLFIGRIEERKAVQSALETVRLVTLTGHGGVGKSRLALAVAEEAAADFPGGVQFIDLAPIWDGKAVAQAVASSMGLHVGIDSTPEEALCRVLGKNRVLLILDNGEQIVAACARLVVHLLQACPSLHILCTSRQPLYVPGENVWVVSPLAVPPEQSLTEDAVGFAASVTSYDSVAMLLDRVALTAPSFQLTPNNAAAVAQVCRQLDGLPLALELVAALFRSLPLPDIAQRLDKRLRLLTGGDSTLPRQQTLHATIEWSYDLLTEAERTLLRRLSVFVGGWTLDAAEIVCADTESESAAKEDSVHSVSPVLSASDVLDLLVALIDKSLVVYEGFEERGRYRLLETTREFAATHLTTEEKLSLQKRHAEFFKHMVWLLETGGAGLQWQERLKQLWIERDNLRAAHAWYQARNSETALWLEFLLYNTRVWPVQNAREWIARLQNESLPQTDVWARVAYSVACWAIWIDHPASEQLLKQALEVACASEEKSWKMRVYEALTSLEEVRGNMRQALEYSEATLAAAREGNKSVNISEFSAKVALNLWSLGEVGAAHERLQTMLQEGRESGDWHLIYYALSAKGGIAHLCGEYAQTRACILEILPLAERYLPFAMSDLWRNLSWAAFMEQDFTDAWHCLEKALASSRQMHAFDREGWTRFDMAEFAFRQGDSTGAREQLLHALSVFEAINEPRSVGRCLQKAAKFCAAWGEPACEAILLSSRRSKAAPLR